MPTPHAASTVSSKVYAETFDHLRALVRMGVRGVRVDLARLAPLKTATLQKIEDIKAGLLEHAVYRAFLKAQGLDVVNINSPQQKQKLVFDYIGLRPQKKSKKTGAPSCDGDFLLYNQEAHPILPLLLEWSEAQKLLSSFVEGLPGMIRPGSVEGTCGTIHPEWRIGGAATWRLSCANPNLQNQAKVPELRRCFVPRPGYRFVEGDLSQAEPRIIASLAGEESWIKAFRERRDIYVEIYRSTKKVEEVTKVQRQWAKTLLLAVSYGLSARGAAQKLGMSEPDAVALIDAFWDSQPAIRHWKINVEHMMLETGLVVGPHGKVRRFDLEDIKEAKRAKALREKWAKAYLEGLCRVAVNFQPQSLCGHLTLEAMVRSHKRYPQWPIVLQVHDSILWEVPESEITSAVPLLRGLMEEADNYPWLKVPLKSDFKVGDDWGSMQEVG